MSDYITISINELRALLRKAFEGVFGHGRDWDAMADQVIWLETRGLNGMKTFFEAYPAMNFENKAKISKSAEGDYHIESNAASLLEYAHLLADVLLSEIGNNTCIKTKISGAKAPFILLAAIERFKNAGFSAAAYMPDEVIWLLVASAEKDIKSLIPPDSQLITDLYVPMHSAEILDTGYSMNHGDYKKLCEYADKVLVPASEKSRQGAGE